MFYILLFHFLFCYTNLNNYIQFVFNQTFWELLIRQDRLTYNSLYLYTAYLFTKPLGLLASCHSVISWRWILHTICKQQARWAHRDLSHCNYDIALIFFTTDDCLDLGFYEMDVNVWNIWNPSILVNTSSFWQQGVVMTLWSWFILYTTIMLDTVFCLRQIWYT